MKVAANILAALLVLAFVAPPAVKLEDAALTGVIVVGLVLMLVDLWQSVREHE